MADSTSESAYVTDALVEAARTDGHAFGQLYDAYYDRILSYCGRRLYQRSVAEDVCGDVFLYVAKNMRSFKGRTAEDFHRWVYRVATTEINAYVRRTKRREELWTAALQTNRLTVREPDGVREPPDATELDAIQHAMARLTSKEQTVVILRIFDDLNYNQIADVVGIRSGTARVIYSRAIKRLRELVGQAGAADSEHTVRDTP